MLADRPDLLVVQGDTSSALGAALAGFTAGIPVAHVEAGLRTHDPLLPWPEEEYRTAIDAQARLLFAPTETAAANLRAEQVPGEIYVTGNTSIDAVLAIEGGLPAPEQRNSTLPKLLVTAHRRESWGEGLRSIAAALRELSNDAEIDFVLHPNPHLAAAMRELLDDAPNIHLLDPCGHLELVRRMSEADLILSDSGGIQRRRLRSEFRCSCCATRQNARKESRSAAQRSSALHVNGSFAKPNACSTIPKCWCKCVVDHSPMAMEKRQNRSQRSWRNG